MSENAELMPVPVMGSEIALLQEKAQVDVQISTAKAFPRNIKRATENAIAVATIDQETAATCNYALPRGGKSISGPSVHLAKIIVQLWGNMRTEAKVISVDETTITSQGVAWDLESNVAMKVEVKRSIMTKTGRMKEDMIVVTGNAANSIALRNAIFSVVPKGVTDKVYKAAIGAITGDISDENKLIKKRKAVFDGFIQSYGVTETEVLSLVGKQSISNVTGEDLVTMIGIAQAIKDGDTTVELAFKKPSADTIRTGAAEDEMNALIADINNAKSKAELEALGTIPDALLDLYNERLNAVK